jgi:hypothetical protein
VVEAAVDRSVPASVPPVRSLVADRRRQPRTKIIRRVSGAIGTPLDGMSESDRRVVYGTASQVEPRDASDFVRDQGIERYCDGLTAKECPSAREPARRVAVRTPMRSFGRLLDENPGCAGFSVPLPRKRAARAETDLFTSRSSAYSPKD